MKPRICGFQESVPENWGLTKKIPLKVVGEKKPKPKHEYKSTEKKMEEASFLAGFATVLNTVVNNRKRRKSRILF